MKTDHACCGRGHLICVVLLSPISYPDYPFAGQVVSYTMLNHANFQTYMMYGLSVRSNFDLFD